MEVHRWNLKATMRPKVVAAIDEQQPGQESPLIRRWSRKSFLATCDRVANWRGEDHTSVPRPQHSGVIDLRGRVCIVRPSSCLAVGHVVMIVGGIVLQ